MGPGWYWINFKAVPEDLDRVGEAEAARLASAPRWSTD
jgi:hypothetical protein